MIYLWFLRRYRIRILSLNLLRGKAVGVRALLAAVGSREHAAECVVGEGDRAVVEQVAGQKALVSAHQSLYDLSLSSIRSQFNRLMIESLII